MSGHDAASLATAHCRAGAPRLPDTEIDATLAALDGWAREDGVIRKTFAFPDYYRTIAFVNALAWIANQQDHHPDLDVRYNRCGVAFSTHDAGGITLNDLICAARVNALTALAG